jgi:gliding motility-associated-like protein
MRDYKLIIILSFMVFAVITTLFAQAPLIIPKPQPIKLALDATGNYTVNINDLVSITNNTDSATLTLLNPNSFNCNSLGKQVVNITASTNGYVSVLTPENVSFAGPLGVAFDVSGNFYVAENNSYVVRKIDAKGQVTTYAGTGVKGYADGPSNTAMFSSVIGIACDSLGNVYVADSGNNTIRKISTSGMVSSFAGNPTRGYVDGKGTNAGFNQPYGMAFDKHQNLYVTDKGNYRIRKITPDGTVTTFAGPKSPGTTAVASFGDLYGLAIDAQGNVYICDHKPECIWKITQDGTVSVYAGNGVSNYVDGPGLSASFIGPNALTFDSAGNLYVADTFIVRKISTNGDVSTVAGSYTSGFVDGQGKSALFTIMLGISLDLCGNIFVSDFYNSMIRKITQSGVVSTVAGSGAQTVINGNVGATSCQSSMLQVPVLVQSTPVITSVFNNVTVTDCSNLADYTLKAQATDNCPVGAIKFTQSPPANTVFKDDSPVTVTITATDSTGGSSSVSFKVTPVNTASAPGRSVTVTTATDKICQGMPVTFNAQVINGDTGTNYQWLVNGKDTGPDSPEFTTSTLNDGDIVNCAVTTGSGCGIPNTGLDIKMSVSPVPSIVLAPIQHILPGAGVQLNPQITGDIATYTWTPATGLSNAAIPNPGASPGINTTYKLTVTSTAGCTDTASVNVLIIERITIPNTFTPNNDGINDLWNIPYLTNYQNCTVNIFNRYGQRVFHTIGYGNPWNGTINGKPLPMGSYYYIIDLKDGSKPRSGEVTILR